jgi:hypothetical protein
MIENIELRNIDASDEVVRTNERMVDDSMRLRPREVVEKNR